MMMHGLANPKSSFLANRHWSLFSKDKSSWS